MKSLNPHDVWWASATPGEVDVWFRRLEESHEPAISMGDLADVRPYILPLIKPMLLKGDKTFLEDIVNAARPQPARLFLVAGKVFGFIVAEAKSHG